MGKSVWGKVGNFAKKAFNPSTAIGAGLMFVPGMQPMGAAMLASGLLQGFATDPETGEQVPIYSGGGGGGAPPPGLDEVIANYAAQNPAFAKYMWQATKQYQPLYTKLAAQGRSMDRRFDMKDAARLAPRLQGIRTAAEMPETTAMRGELMRGILSDLQAGGSMTPEQEAATLDAVRSAQIARGLGEGNSAALREAVAKAMEMQGLLERRRQAASSALAQEYGASPNPFTTILGRSPTALQLGANQTQRGFLPFSAAASLTRSSGGGGGGGAPSVADLVAANPGLANSLPFHQPMAPAEGVGMPAAGGAPAAPSIGRPGSTVVGMNNPFAQGMAGAAPGGAPAAAPGWPANQLTAAQRARAANVLRGMR